MLKYSLLILLLFQTGFTQRISNKDLDFSVLGYFIYENSTYLVTPEGYVQLRNSDINKQYENYYRQIYGDSTITNPNLILENSSQNQFTDFIVPFIDLSQYPESYIPLNDTLKLFNFININESGELIIRDDIAPMLKRNFVKSQMH